MQTAISFGGARGLTRRMFGWLKPGIVCLGVFAFLIGAVNAPGAWADPVASADVEWTVEISVSFPPDQVRALGGEAAIGAMQSALTSRLRSRGVSAFEFKPRVREDGGRALTLTAAGKGTLAQFKQVLFEDMTPMGGLLGGPAALILTGGVNQGEVVSLTLENNPSTGYLWEVAQMDRAALRQVGGAEFKTKSNLLGAPANQMMRLQAMKTGSASVTFAYRRPWEADAQPTRRITLRASRLSTLADLSDPALPQQRPEEPQPETKPRAPVAMGTLPGSFDWRTTGKVTAVRDQGNCGSCWAFGTVAPFESNLLIKQNLTTNLSEQYLVSCNHDGWSCSGGWWAHDYHISKYFAPQTQAGAVLESAFPYTASNGSCTVAYSHPYRLARWVYVGSSSGVPTPDAIKQAIYTHGPVSAAVCVGSAFQVYRSGIFSTNETCSGRINHAVTLVGWDDAQQYWIMKNSWGTGWGESGYMRIRWNTSNIGYAANYVDDTTLPPPSNDDFNNATVINSVPYNTTQDTTVATSASDDPTFTCVSGKRYNTVWYRYTPSQTGTLTVDTLGSSYDTVLAVWTGSRGSLTSVGCNDDYSGATTSRLQISVAQGQTYYFEVASYSGGGGQLTLNMAGGTSTCYTLTKSVSPSGGGSVSANPAPNCNNNTQYTAGTNVTLTASANSGYSFSNWGGDISGTANPTTVTMNANKNVTANFSTTSTCYTLTTSVNPSGGGSISKSPAPNCNNGTQYTTGTNVTLTANANSGYTFSNWSGSTSGSANPTTVTMNANKSVTANFSTSSLPNDDFNNATVINAVPYSRSQSTAAATTGSDDPNFTCVSGKKYNTVWYRYTPSQSATLTIDTLGSNYDTVLAVWTGSRGNLTSVGCNDDSSGTTSRLQIPVTQGQTYYIEVASYFSGGGQLTLNVTGSTSTCYTLTTSVSPSGGGSISKSPAPNCNSGTQYTSGTNVTLTANANAGYTFSNWSGDVGSTVNPTTVTMNANKSVTANFGSNAPGQGTYDDTDARIRYTGSWQVYAASGAIGNTLHFSSSPGQSAQFTFNGQGATIVYAKYYTGGVLRVAIDGVTVAHLSQSTDGIELQQRWTSGNLSPGTHTLTLTHASGAIVFLDAIIIPEPPLRTYDDTHADIRYTGAWLLGTGVGPLNNTIHYSQSVGQSAQFTFSGQKVIVVYAKYYNGGVLRVAIDGVTVAHLSQSAGELAWQQRWTSGALSPGAHTVTLTHASGALVFLDAIIVQ